MANKIQIFSAAELAVINANSTKQIRIFDNHKQAFLHDPTFSLTTPGDKCIFSFNNGFSIGELTKLDH